MNKQERVERDRIILERLESGMTARQAVDGLGCSHYVCSHLLKKLGRKGRSGRQVGKWKKFTPEQEELVRLYKTGLGADEIAELKSVNRMRVYYALKSAGIPRRSASLAARSHKLNESFFETIDTEAKAYWLGFLSADGNVTGNTIQVDLKDTDGEHLKRFARDLESDYEVSIREMCDKRGGKIRRQARLAFSSEKMAADLRNLGVTPRKSATLIPWRGEPDLLRHYWRGYFDGDGSIFTYADGRWGMGLVSLSRTVIEFFVRDVEMATGIKSAIVAGHGTSDCKYSGINTCKPVSAWLYGDSSVFLDRKMIKATALAEQTPKIIRGQIGVGRPFVDEAGKMYKTQKEAAMALGVGQPSISACLRNKIDSTNGHSFGYVK